MFDRVWVNASLATMEPAGDDPLGIITDGALAAKDGRIAWVGPRAELPGSAAPVTECGGAWILPGLIDCHTHLVFGGDRASEFEQRLAGAIQTLQIVSPLATLGRGYSILLDERGQAVRAASQVQPGQKLHARLAEGELEVRVLDNHQAPVTLSLLD